jgi:DNA-binding NarL/FixJ family response regulator
MTPFASPMTNEITVVVIDAERNFREDIADAVETVPGFHVVASSGSVSEGLDELSRQTAHLVILESNRSPSGATTFLPRARAQGFTGSVVVVTGDMSLAEGAALVQQGVSAICPKDRGVAPILEVMQLAAQGVTTIEERYFRAATEFKAGIIPDLNEREWQIIHHLMNGLSNRQIAARIRLSEGTVKATLRRIYDITGVRSRGQLVCMLLNRTAMREGRLASQATAYRH